MSEENEVTSVVPVNPQGEIVSIEQSIQSAQKYVDLMGKIRMMAISLLNGGDLSNQGDKPYIEKSGCDKIAAAFGVQIFDTEFTKEQLKDDKGEYVIYTCSGCGRWNNHTEREIGMCSSRDDFFGKKGGELKPLSEVDLTDIKKKAMTNFANRIIKKLIGLSFTWEELSMVSGGKISQDTVNKVSFAKGARGGNQDSPETKKKRDEIRSMLLKLCLNDVDKAREKLIAKTAFTGKDGKTVEGRDNVLKLSEKQVDILYSKLTKEAEEFDKEAGQ